MSSFAEKSKQWVFDHKYGLLAVAVMTLLSVILFQKYLFSDEMLLAQDQLRGYGGWAYYERVLRSGGFPLWSEPYLSGMPAFEGLPGDALYPPFLFVLYFFSPKNLHGMLFFLHTILAGVLAYHFVRRRLELPVLFSMLLGAAYMLNTNFISHIYPGHTGKFYLLAWLPLGLHFLLGLLGSGSLKHAVGLALFVGIAMYTSHVQLLYFVLMGFFLLMTVPLVVSLSKKEISFSRAGRIYALFWGAVFLGIGIGAPILLPAMSYTSEYSIRGSEEYTSYEHATSWSAHPEETASLLIPEFGGILETYWGRNPFKLNSEYPGLLIWILGILGVVMFRNRMYWLTASIGVLSIIYALGAHTPFFRLFYEIVPGIDKFRAASMMLFWLSTALFLMSAWFLRDLLAWKAKATEDKLALYGKRMLIAAAVVFGIGLLMSLTPQSVYNAWNGLFTDVMGSRAFQMQTEAASQFAKGAFRFGLLAGAALALTALFMRSRLQPMQYVLSLSVIVAIDLLPLDMKFIQTVDADRIFPEIPLYRDLGERDIGNYRVFDLPSAYSREVGFTALYGFKTVTGFFDNELKWYRNLHGPGYANFMQGLEVRSMPAARDGRYEPGTVGGSALLDMLNVKYILARDNRGNPIYLENATKLPYAYWMGNAVFYPEEEILDFVTSPKFEPRNQVVLSQDLRDRLGLQTHSDSVAGLVPADADYGNSRIEVRVDAPEEGILVLSEVYYPKWQVRVDGKEAELLQVNYSLRGVRVPAGASTVVFEYVPRQFYAGWGLAIFSLLILGGLAAVPKRFSELPEA